MEKSLGKELSKTKIFLPNRRSCRELKRVFAISNKNFILPDIKAISDISYEDFFDFTKGREFIDGILPIENLDKVDYLLFLAKEISDLAAFGENLEFEQAFKIAIHLQNLFEDFERDEISFDKFVEIDDVNLSLHRQITLDFLKKLYIKIKNSLIKNNYISEASKQNLIVKRYSEILEKYPPQNPIIIAGSTGSNASSRNLIKAILNQKNSKVILFGLDGLEQRTPKNHPQFLLNQLLEFLEIEKKSVTKIAKKEFLVSENERQKLISLMMLPDEEALAWQKAESMLDIAKLNQDLDRNLKIIETKNEIEEAKIIGLILAQNQDKKSALISNNDRLVSLTKSWLKNNNISFNDSRNLKIFDARIISFLLLILELVESDFDAAILLAVLKNNLCSFGDKKELLAEFEIKILRQERRTKGLSGILEALKESKNVDLIDYFNEFYNSFNPNPPLCHPRAGGDPGNDPEIRSLLFQPIPGPRLRGDDKVGNVDNKEGKNLADATKNLIKTAENLSKKTWLELLSFEPCSAEIFEFFTKLSTQNNIEISNKKFSKFLRNLLSQISYFEKSNATSNIQILSTIEARLLNFDLIIAASMNEGVFPQIESDSWLGKKIKKDLGIDKNLQKIGQNAYDFCNYLSNKSIFITRSRINNGAVLIESPFLLKLKTLCKKLGIKIDSGEKYFLHLHNANHASINAGASQINEKINYPLQKISITDVANLIQNPYLVYAKRILQLKELKKIDFDGSYAEFGSFIHKALEEFVKNPDNIDFKKIFKNYFNSDEAELIWWPKFENIFNNFLEINQQFLSHQNFLELPVELRIGTVMMSGKIDRIAIDKMGEVQIIDYKTGSCASKKEVASGTNPQLTLAALALAEGVIKEGIKNIDKNKISGLNYLELSAYNKAKMIRISDKNEEIENLITQAKSGLERLLNYFNCENGSYNLEQNNATEYEYKHLIRCDE